MALLNCREVALTPFLFRAEFDHRHFVFNSNVVNQARLGYSRLRNTSTPEEPFTAAELGISNPLRNLFPGMPTLIVTGLFTLGGSPFADQSSRINTFSAGDTLSILAGSHHLRIGGEYRRSQLNFFFNAFTRGQIMFASFNDFLIGNGVSVIGSGVFDRAGAHERRQCVSSG